MEFIRASRLFTIFFRILVTQANADQTGLVFEVSCVNNPYIVAHENCGSICLLY